MNIYVISMASVNGRLLVVNFWGRQSYTWIFDLLCTREVGVPALFRGQLSINVSFKCLKVEHFICMPVPPTT